MNTNAKSIVASAAVALALMVGIPVAAEALPLAAQTSSFDVEASAEAKARRAKRAPKPRKACTGRGKARRCSIVGAAAPAPAPAAAPAPVAAPVPAAAAPGGGDANAFGFLFPNGGNPGRWNPCVALHYSINAAKAPAGGVADVQEAIRRIGSATGINFVYDGPTAAVPQNNDDSSATVIAWAAPGESNMLTGSAAGVGGAAGISSNGYVKLTKGFVVIDSTRSVPAGFGGGVSQGALLMHELGHMMGLDHSGDQNQIMYPTVTSATPSDWGAGDRNGLTRLGATNGCIG